MMLPKAKAAIAFLGMGGRDVGYGWWRRIHSSIQIVSNMA
jgi:hypothetical protein